MIDFKSIGIKVGAVLAGLGLGVSKAFAQTPVPVVVDADATQLLVNGMASIRDTLFSIAGIVWPYALTVMLFFLAIRFGMSFFKRH